MKSKVKVIDSLWTFAVAVAFLGPLALPLLWRNPRFSVQTKLAGSVFIVLLTVALIKIFGNTVEELQKTYQQLQELNSKN